MADTLLTVAMSVERWQQVLALLGEVAAPLRVTLPLVTEIQQQCQKQTPANGPTAEQPNVPH